MKTLTYNQPDIRERGMSADNTFTSRFVTRNRRALDVALKATRASLQRSKSVAIHTYAEFRRAIAVKH